MTGDAPWQPSWLTPVSLSWTVRPLQAPTPVPAGTELPVTVPEPAMSKSAAVQPPAPAPVTLVTLAVTVVRCTAPVLVLLKLPDSVCGAAPGSSPVLSEVCLTLTLPVEPAVAPPVPEPPVVQ